MKRFSSKSLEKRKAGRVGYGDFYRDMVESILNGNEKCVECNERLIGDVSEVAHILPKTTFKSIALNPKNILFLCSWKSKNNCHSKFDSDGESMRSMNIYTEVLRQTVKELLDEVSEKVSYKVLDRWELE